MNLLMGLLVSSVGFVLFRYGRKQERWPQGITGLVLLIGPMFTSGALACTGLGAVALLGMWLALRMGC